MAKTFLTPIDLSGNELRNAPQQSVGSLPDPVVRKFQLLGVGTELYWSDGTAWVTVRQQPMDSTPTGPAGGDLAGTYPNPVIADGAVRDAHVAADAAITLSKLATDPLARANHTGTQLAATISNFDATVRATRLDEFAAPTAPVAIGGQRITGLAEPTASGDATTKSYVDAAAQGLDVKASVRAASTTSITLTGTQSVDGVSLSNGDRVLVKAQSAAAENGIYVVSAGAWSRAEDADTDADVTPGLFVFVEQGTANADTGWVLATDAPITLGTTGLSFTQFTSAGSVTAGAGLTRTGNTLDVGGTIGRITVTADNVDIDSQYVGQPSITTVGTVGTGSWEATPVGVTFGGTGATTAAGARANLGVSAKVEIPIVGGATSEVLTHNLNTRAVQVTVYRTSTPWDEVELDVEHTTTGSVTVRSAIALPANTYNAVIVG